MEELIVPHSPRPTLFDHLRELGCELARALRRAAKRPTFSLVAMATLGIGIGASTATAVQELCNLRFESVEIVSRCGLYSEVGDRLQRVVGSDFANPLNQATEIDDFM